MIKKKINKIKYKNKNKRETNKINQLKFIKLSVANKLKQIRD